MDNHMKAEKWNFKRHPICNFTIPEELEFVERYKKGETFSNMADGLGVSRNSLWKIVTRVYGTEPYQTRGYPGLYDIDTEAFKEIDSEESAYALGLVATDGHVYLARNQINFDSTDKEQIDNLKQCLECTREPYVYEPRTSEIDGKAVVGRKKVYKIRFGPKKICKDFMQYFEAEKSNRNSIPRVIRNNEYVRHFVRGVVDGDGCVSKGLYITGQRGFLEDLQNIFVENLGISKTKLHSKSANSHTYDFQLKGRHQLARAYRWLYNNSNYSLSRKKGKFEEII